MTAESSGREVEIAPPANVIDMNTRHAVNKDGAIGPVELTPGEMFDIYNDRLDRIECAVEDNRKTLADIRETMVRTEQMVQTFLTAVKPVVDDLIPTVVSLSEHPMLRTFLGGKKKNK